MVSESDNIDRTPRLGPLVDDPDAADLTGSSLNVVRRAYDVV